jgi:hypothetical protein
MITEGIVIALIGLIGAVMVALLQRHRRESGESNNLMIHTITRIDTKLDRHDEKLDSLKEDFLKHKTEDH